MRRITPWLRILTFATATALLGGCYYYGPPPRAGAVWVPGHYGPNGFWIRGHWGP